MSINTKPKVKEIISLSKYKHENESAGSSHVHHESIYV